MPDCDHCGDSFDDETAYLAHLDAEHADELGVIERRRVEELNTDDGGIGTGPLVLGGVVVAAAVLVAYLVLVAGGTGSGGVPDSVEQVAQEPTDTGSVHYHGTIEIVVAGDPVDLSRDRYQLADRGFHFEGGDGERWHAHARGVTLEYALATLDIGATTDSVWYDGTRYTDGENANVTLTVDGESVNPKEYVLQQGDAVRVVVRPN
jgi:hypothetical protein